MRLVSCVFAFVVFFSAAAQAETVMANHKESKIRSGPATGYPVLWRPRLYTPFEVLAKYETWYAVRDVEGDVGWIHDSGASKENAAIVTADIINVHESAGADSRVLYQAPKNYTFKIEESKDGWLKVLDPDNETGWIADKGVWKGEKRADSKAEMKDDKKADKKSEKKGEKQSKKKSGKHEKKSGKKKSE